MYSNLTGKKSVLKDRRTEQRKLELEKKDAKIEQMKNKIAQWEVAYKKVQGRNAWLLKMMQDEGLRLCAALEQESYKVKQLQAE